MSTPVDIISAVKTVLQNSSYLSYVDDTHIFLGVRDRITSFPSIVIEILDDTEDDDTYTQQEIIMRLAIIGYTKITDKDKQIVGDDNLKGVANLRNDIAKAICADRTLGVSGANVWATVKSANYEYAEESIIRGVAVSVDIKFNQNSVSRA